MNPDLDQGHPPTLGLVRWILNEWRHIRNGWGCRRLMLAVGHGDSDEHAAPKILVRFSGPNPEHGMQLRLRHPPEFAESGQAWVEWGQERRISSPNARNHDSDCSRFRDCFHHVRDDNAALTIIGSKSFEGIGIIVGVSVSNPIKWIVHVQKPIDQGERGGSNGVAATSRRRGVAPGIDETNRAAAAAEVNGFQSHFMRPTDGSECVAGKGTPNNSDFHAVVGA